MNGYESFVNQAAPPPPPPAYGYPFQQQPPPPLPPPSVQQPVASTSQLPFTPVSGDWTTQIPFDTLTGGTQLAGGTQLVKVTAKSCSNCRTRKVKCDRRYPECTRCTKRKELCDYGEDVSIALRPTWVLPTEEDNLTSPAVGNIGAMRTHDSLVGPRPSSRAPYTPAVVPYPLRPPPQYDSYQSVRALSDMQHHQAIGRQRAAGADSGGGLTVRRTADRLPGTGARYRGGGEYEDGEGYGEQGFADLWEKFLRASNLGQSSSDWRLALPTMASSLQIHLIDASMHSCCFHLPAFHIFNPDIQYFKENIDQLDLASQVIVGILTSLGARASPHSALLGIAGPDIENGRASLDLVLSAGNRRENAWRAIVKRATELCSKMEILQVPSARNLQTVVAFVQMLMLAEVQPSTARFFLRTAMGLFRDMQHGGLPAEEVQATKLSVGPTLFESDARIAAYLSMPVCITDDDLYEYFDGTGVHVPDLANEDLGPLLDEIFDSAAGPITREKLDHALGLTGYFVCAVQRAFSNLSSNRRPNTRFLTTIPQLWSYIDRAHAAVQRLHRRLVQLDYAPAGCDAHHSVDYDLLIGVRMDERLLDVVNLAHVWLHQQRRILDLTLDDRAALDDLLATSERRVRKCLKLLAFYSKVFVDSLDKHCVYHLVTQLEALPGWATMIAQREDESTDFGPLPAECALTEIELDWFTRALELACFFTPLANDRLRELDAARAARRVHTQAPFAAFSDFDRAFSAPMSASAATMSSLQPYPQRQQQPRNPFPVLSTPQNPSVETQPSAPTAWTFDSYDSPLAFASGGGEPASSLAPGAGPIVANGSSGGGTQYSGAVAEIGPGYSRLAGNGEVYSPEAGSGSGSRPGSGTDRGMTSGTGESSPSSGTRSPPPADPRAPPLAGAAAADSPFLRHGPGSALPLPPTPAKTNTPSPPPVAPAHLRGLSHGGLADAGAYPYAAEMRNGAHGPSVALLAREESDTRIVELAEDGGGGPAAAFSRPVSTTQGMAPVVAGPVEPQAAWRLYAAGAGAGAGEADRTARGWVR